MARGKTSKRSTPEESDSSATSAATAKPAKKRKTTKIPETTDDTEKRTRQAVDKKRRKDKASTTSKKSKVVKEEGQAETKDKVSEVRSATKDSAKFVGAHTSIAGGLHNAVSEAVDIGARAFGLFLKNQRQWNSKPLEDEAAQKFKDACKEHGFAPHMILPHGSYLMNCGSPKQETLDKSRAMLVDELQRCEKLGLTLFNFHPGSTCGEITVDESLDRIAESINDAHAQTKYVITVIENMSCQGNTIGGKFEELKGIIDRVDDKTRMGVCLDTCHAFAAGFNIATEEGYEQMMSDFDSIVGMKYLKALHLNDSKGDCGCHLDRHENIGRGKLGRETFQRIMKDPRLDGLPFVLETPGGQGPGGAWAKEIKLLYNFCDGQSK